MNTLEKNIKQLEHILDALEWESFLVNNYVNGQYSFTSFALTPTQRFEDLVKQMLPFLRKNPNYRGQLNHQMSTFLKKLYFKKWKSILSITEILRLAEIIFSIEKDKENVIHLLLQVEQSLPHIISKFLKTDKTLTKREINEFRNFLSVTIRLIYLAKSIKPATKQLDNFYLRLNMVLVQNDNAIFNGRVLNDNPEITRINFYKYAWLLMYEPQNWIDHLDDQLEYWAAFEKKHQAMDETERLKKRRRAGILSANKALNLISDFKANNIISKTVFEEGVDVYNSVNKEKFRKQFGDLFEQYLLNREEVEVHLSIENKKDTEISIEGELGEWINDDSNEVSLKYQTANSKQIFEEYMKEAA